MIEPFFIVVLLIISDGYTTDELDFVWHPYKTPLKMRSNLVLPEFEITGSSARNCDANFTTGINCPILKCTSVFFLPVYVLNYEQPESFLWFGPQYYFQQDLSWLHFHVFGARININQSIMLVHKNMRGHESYS